MALNACGSLWALAMALMLLLLKKKKKVLVQL